MYPLTGAVRPYAWGSRTVIASLQGRPTPTETPEAELWLGAHPGNPSTVAGKDGPVSLDTLIAGDPNGQLGASVASAFGPRLPFLLKVLAAEAPLSLQAHPSSEYARTAYAKQEADPALPKNYTDAYHKPEMLVALTEFSALCGFRSPQVSAEVLASFGISALDPVVASLRAGDLRGAVEALLTWPADSRPALIDAVVAAARGADELTAAGAEAALAAAGVDAALASASAEAAFGAGAAHAAAVPGKDDYALALDLAAHYPGDPGVLVALLLNHVRLAPGEAIWMPAGNLHAYLHGAGVELMAASDNVLRGGLTPKRVDVGELLNVLVFEVLDDPILPSTPVGPGIVTWEVPVPDFTLYRLDLDGTLPPLEVPAHGPRIVLCTDGEVFVGESLDGTPVEVLAGGAAYAPADAGHIKVAGKGQVFVAAVPSDPTPQKLAWSVQPLTVE
ncbi:mannose-6-phosphate isomerase, class I [Actinoplanes sp. TBRC 11911]|nr:mannose-6-phosphate isomerase, class I [Actinoplanes sp. TBRC 11911]